MMYQSLLNRTGTRARGFLLLAALLASSLLAASVSTPAFAAGAQADAGQPGGRGAYAGMQRVNGEITAVNGATLTVKVEDGGTMQVVTTDNTRVMKGRGVPVKVAELKPGDGVMAAGNLDAPNKTLHAAMIFATDAAQLKALRDNLGKTYIAGKVTAIDLDNATLTVERPDHVVQTIGLDESTSFRRGRGLRPGAMGMGGMGAEGGSRPPRSGGSGANADGGESITLADIKVGDNVAGQGAIKNGVFVPKELQVATPRPRPAPDSAAKP